MAIGDLLVGVTGTITGVLLKTKQNKHIHRPFGTIPLFGSMFVSILSLGFMTLDRLIAVKYSLSYHRIMTKRRAMILIAVSWFIPILLTVIEGIIFIQTPIKTELKVRSAILGVFFTFGSITLCASNGMLYYFIYQQQKGIRKTSFPLQSSLLSTKSDQKGNHKGYDDFTTQNKQKCKKLPSRRDIKASTLCIWITVAFVVCWIPLTGYRLSYIMGRTNKIFWLRRLGLCLASANSLVNPIIYFMKRKDFQRYLKRMVSDKKITSLEQYQ